MFSKGDIGTCGEAGKVGPKGDKGEQGKYCVCVCVSFSKCLPVIS